MAAGIFTKQNCSRISGLEIFEFLTSSDHRGQAYPTVTPWGVGWSRPKHSFSFLLTNITVKANYPCGLDTELWQLVGAQAEITQISCPGPKCSIVTQVIQSLPCVCKSNFHFFTLYMWFLLHKSPNHLPYLFPSPVNVPVRKRLLDTKTRDALTPKLRVQRLGTPSGWRPAPLHGPLVLGVWAPGITSASNKSPRP